MRHYPKVLLCAPQHVIKMYCWEQWYARITSLTYPNYDIFIADNSPNSENAEFMDSHDRVKAIWTDKQDLPLLELIDLSHKQCQEYAIKNGYDYMFHLETDVLPPLDVIERLMVKQRPICAGVYDIFFGSKRKAMVQIKEGFDRTIRGDNVVKFLEHNEPTFFNGKCQEVYHAGLGCILIHIDILKQVPFRVVKGYNYHTDTWFANDCFVLNKDIYVDTSVQCKHMNLTWLTNLDKLEV